MRRLFVLLLVTMGCNMPVSQPPASKQAMPVTTTTKPRESRPSKTSPTTLVATAPKEKPHPSGLMDKKLQIEFDLLDDKAKYEIGFVRKKIEKEGLDSLDGEEKRIFERHMKFLMIQRTVDDLLARADKRGAQKILDNLGNGKRKDLVAFKLRYALEVDDFLDQDALRISEKVKKGGFASLEGADKEIVAEHKWIFYPPNE